jgi:hypothetical protein
LVPPGTTHILVSFSWPTDSVAGTYAHVELSTDVKQGVRAGLHRAIIGGARANQPCTILAAVSEVARMARLQVFQDPRTSCRLELKTVDFLAIGEPMPIGAVGAVFCGLDTLASSLLELINHYSHYRASALEFERCWSGYHRPAKLLAELLANVGSRPTDARVAPDLGYHPPSKSD